LDFGPEMVIGLLIRAPVVLFSLTIHEFMHGWVAYRCGDDTAYRAGRLTLNPIAHLDPIGTICLFLGPIGWAKPVPIDPANFNYETRRRDEILVSGAGVAANFAIAVVLALAARALVARGLVPDSEVRDVQAVLWAMLGSAVLINFGLAIFNLIPLFPLDGSHILQNLLPLNAAIRYAEFRRVAPFILLGLVLVNRSIGFLAWPIFRLTEVFAGPLGADTLFSSLFRFW
jgi:Zn-dependent protease